MAKLDSQEHDGLAPGTVVDGRYKVVRPIGQGGSGMVYEVEHARTGRKLALKALIEETGLARLEQEARAASMMKNGHTAHIVDMQAGGPTGAYMVMDLLDGQSLRGLLDDAGQLPLELTVNIAMQICECLHEAHGLGIIHRDLKPENVFLCPSPWPGQYDVKVLDFGVMKIADGGSAIPKSSLTRTGSTVGTPYYMSLEQLRNSSGVDARADIYSLGVVLYECLSGRKPFQADTIGDLVYALCSGPPTQLARIRPDLPAEVAEMVMRTLSANRDDRPASMIDFAVGLLPLANPAFALWVKVDGKQPALAAAQGHASPPLPPRPAPSGRQDVAPPPRPAFAPPPSIDPPPATGGAWGREGPSDGGRRDTPTEMYVKGVHGPALPSADDDGDRESSGDRDTPTRAIALDALPRAAPMLEPQGAPLHAPRFGAPPGAGPPSVSSLPGATHPFTSPVPPPAASRPGTIQPGASEAKLTMPLGDFMRGAPPPSGPSSTVGPPKPAWQEKLDRALIGMGRFGELQAQRFRAAPKSTRLAVSIAAGAVAALLLLALILHALS